MITKNHNYQKIEYNKEEIDNLMDELFNDEENLSEEEYQEKIAKKEINKGKILVNKKEYDFLLDFYQDNKKIIHSKMSKNMEKIISEATAEVIEKMSKVVSDAEQKASEKINQELAIEK